ncbi:MAG TPA: AMP-dependent synthetase/ligase [Ramlibacter sp.]|nr:AMP-dependent synthetase/ligase [Ramlibacter sp.]
MQKPTAHTLDTIPFRLAPTLPRLFEERCARSAGDEAYRQFDAAAGTWHRYSWDTMRRMVRRWRAALAREQLPAGERVALMLPNCVEWICFDMAAQSLGLVVVPLYPDENPEHAAFQLSDCGARVLLLGGGRDWAALAPTCGQLPHLKRTLCLGADAGGHAGALTPVERWLEGAALPEPALSEDADTLATIVYTSGTTGRPKGVMLSHGNILRNVEAVLQCVAGYREDVYLSFLPLSHMFERTVGCYLPMAAGSTVVFARSLQSLPHDLLAVRPTVLVSVPHLYERLHAALEQELQEKGPAARALFAWAEEIGWRRFEAAQHRGEPPGALARFMWPVLRRLTAEKLLGRLGGRLRIAVTGGAPISPRLAHRLIGLGLPLLQGYGLTEAAPIVTVNAPADNAPESVGRALPGIELRLGAGGELLVRGPNVMRGYWNAPTQTREALDADGWLHTGDLASIDTGGHVHILGRSKDILVTSNGEKVPPADLERAITGDPLFEQAMVVGDGRPYLVALAVLNRQGWQALARQLGVPWDAPAALQRPEVRHALLRHAQARLHGFPACAQVRAVWATLEPWTRAEGLLTPTLKIRRAQLVQRFAPALEEIYAGPAHAD